MKPVRKKIFIYITTIITIIASIMVLYNQKYIVHENNTNPNISAVNPDINQKYVYIYFTDEESEYLKAEKRRILFNTDSAQYAKALMKILLNGPKNKKLFSPIPERTKLISLYLKHNNTVVVDFSEEIKDNHPGGSQAEILTIYSIVDTLTLNIKKIKRVQILINGKEADTLAGHIALNFPLKENLDLIQ